MAESLQRGLGSGLAVEEGEEGELRGLVAVSEVVVGLGEEAAPKVVCDKLDGPIGERGILFGEPVLERPNERGGEALPMPCCLNFRIQRSFVSLGEWTGAQGVSSVG